MKSHILILLILLPLYTPHLLILSPESLARKFNNKPIEMLISKVEDLSNFNMKGILYFDTFSENHQACNNSLQPLPTYNESNYKENTGILLAYRGGCPLETKARNAQQAGASMLILINNDTGIIENEKIGEGNFLGKNIKIPIGLISLTEGRIIENHFKYNSDSVITVEVDIKSKEKTIIDFKFFFSSSEKKAYQLLGNITQYLNKFGEQINFIPIYVSHQSPNYDENNQKRELNCISLGKYCYFPKETTITQDGQRILFESLRQKCMYEYNKKENLNAYFEYIKNFKEYCMIEGFPKFNERCSKEILEKMGYLENYFEKCIAKSFNVNDLNSPSYIDNDNKYFNKDYKEILKNELTTFPAVVINDKALNGLITENKVIISLCNAVIEKPDFCPFFTGLTDEHVKNVTKKKTWVKVLIISIIIINIMIFLVCRKYIIQRVSEKIDFSTIDIDGRIHNVINNYLTLKKSQEMDYKSFNNDEKGSRKMENSPLQGVVNTI